MKISKIEKFISDGKAVISALVQSPSFREDKNLFFSFPEKYFDYLSDSADPFVPAVLIPSMIYNEPLEILPPVSSKLIKNQNTIQEIFSVWYPGKNNKIKVTARQKMKKKKSIKGFNATFFSLGVDSMYTMLKYLPENKPEHGKEITSLIYMKGLELPLSTYCQGQDKAVIGCIENVASHYSLEVIAGETNLRDVFPLDWESEYFGPGLAATALSLSNRFSNIYIPASHSFATLFHDPSSVLIDNFWSNEQTSIFHDGSEADRAGKIENLIARDPFALKNLRVCVCNDGGCYNCGKCWKCVRTMVTLKILGKLKDAESFPQELPDDYMKALRIYKPRAMVYSLENLRLSRQYKNPELEKVLSREIRIAKIDLFREGKPLGFFFKEMLYYLLIKTGRKVRLIP